ncbi:YncE family protein [Aminobacter sp. Piv2-1]|uniref:YncE family protein n=1 Tax=Aminobacter sp. Piv2-1 TaxID=3031122 RepID=UPI0030B56203
MTRADAETCNILVCNNYRHRITRHVVGLARTSVRNKILLDRGLDIPDGIALSPDKAWTAVSNHNTHTVLIFDNRSALGRYATAVGTLHGVSYPHGLRFSPDGRRLFVADAGSPHVLVYHAKDGNWSGERNSSLSLVAMSQETFLKGRNNPQEGGPKGLDIDASGRLLVVTCEEQAIACFDITRLPSEDAPGRLPSGWARSSAARPCCRQPAKHNRRDDCCLSAEPRTIVYYAYMNASSIRSQ